MGEGSCKKGEKLTAENAEIAKRENKKLRSLTLYFSRRSPRSQRWTFLLRSKTLLAHDSRMVSGLGLPPPRKRIYRRARGGRREKRRIGENCDSLFLNLSATSAISAVSFLLFLPPPRFPPVWNHEPPCFQLASGKPRNSSAILAIDLARSLMFRTNTLRTIAFRPSGRCGDIRSMSTGSLFILWRIIAIGSKAS